MIGDTTSISPEERHEFLTPLVRQWTVRISQSMTARRPWLESAQQCRSFFSEPTGFMWKGDFKSKFLKDVNPPMFQITINKAFEMVAIIGPYLFWKYPRRAISTPKPLELSIEDFGPPDDPNVQMMFEQVMQQTQERDRSNKLRNSLMERYLNYSQREQPGGGLAKHGELAIIDAMQTGRGVLWPEVYTYPSSGDQMTGLFHDLPENFLVDADSVSPVLEDACWIGRVHCMPTSKVEKLFKLPKGSLHGKGSMESLDSLAANYGFYADAYRKRGQSNDLMIWYEIWSKQGIGIRSTMPEDGIALNMDRELHDAFDDVIGDYAYLCIADGVPWPLNCPSKVLERSTDEEVKDIFRWRASNYGPHFPAHADNRWPVSLLDFYPRTGSCWPVAPLSPAMGWLIAMQVLASAFVEQGYENRKQVIAMLGHMAKDVEAKLRSTENPVFVELAEGSVQDITKAIQYLNRPSGNNWLIEALNYCSIGFDKASGLSEIMYSMNVGGAASRSAKDAAVKEEKASVRPEKMASDVAKFFSDGANLEKFLAGWNISGESLQRLLGEYGAYFWDELITKEDPNIVIREMTAVVEASDVRKPNKERIAGTLQDMMSYMMTVFESYSRETHDTSQINAFIRSIGEAIELDLSEVQLGEWVAQPDPAMQQQMQQQMEQEQQKAEAAMQQQQMKLQSEQIKAQASMQEAQVSLQQAQLDIEMKQIEAMQKQIEAKIAEVQLQAAQANSEIDIVGQMAQLQQDELAHIQNLRQDDEQHDQELQQDREKFGEEIAQMRLKARIQNEAAKQQAKIKQAAAKKQAASTASNTAKKKPAGAK